MCGIAGIFDLAGRPVADAELRAMNDVIHHRGPDDGGQYVEQGRRSRQPPSGNHRPLPGRPPADGKRGRLAPCSSTTASSTTSRELAPLLEARGHTFRSKTDTEVDPACLRGVGPRVPRPLQRHVRVRHLGPAPAASSSSRATASASSRSTTRFSGSRFVFGIRDQVTPRRPESRERSRPRRWSSTSRSRTSSAT